MGQVMGDPANIGNSTQKYVIFVMHILYNNCHINIYNYNIYNYIYNYIYIIIYI